MKQVASPLKPSVSYEQLVDNNQTNKPIVPAHEHITTDDQQALIPAIDLDERTLEAKEASESLTLQEPSKETEITTNKSPKTISHPVAIDDINMAFNDVAMRSTCNESARLRLLNCCYSLGTQTSVERWRSILRGTLNEFNIKSDETWGRQQEDMIRIIQFYLFFLWLNFDRYNEPNDTRITNAFENLSNHTKKLIIRCYLIGGLETLHCLFSVKDMPSKEFKMFPRIGGTDNYTSIPKRLKKHLIEKCQPSYPAFIFELMDTINKIKEIKETEQSEELKDRKIMEHIENIEQVLELTENEKNLTELIRIQLKHPTLFSQEIDPSLEKVPGLRGFKNIANTCFIGASLDAIFACHFPVMNRQHQTLGATPQEYPIVKAADRFDPILEQLRTLNDQFHGNPTEHFQAQYKKLVNAFIAAAKMPREAFTGIESVRGNPSRAWEPAELRQQDASEFLQPLLDDILGLDQNPEFSVLSWPERTISKAGITVTTSFKLAENRPSSVLNIHVPDACTFNLQELLDDTFKPIPSSDYTYCFQDDLDFTSSISGVNTGIQVSANGDPGWKIESERKMLMADTRQIQVITLNFTVPRNYEARQQFKDALLGSPHRVVYLTLRDGETKQETRLPFEIASSTYYEQKLSTHSTPEEAASARSGHYLAVIENELGGLLYDNEIVYMQNKPDVPYRIDHHFGRGIPVLMMLKRISEETAKKIIDETMSDNRRLREQNLSESDEGIELQPMSATALPDVSLQPSGASEETWPKAEEKKPLV